MPPTGNVESLPLTGVTVEIKITFDEFGWSALEERSADQRLGLDEIIALALTYYESELTSGRAAIDVPRFRRSPPRGETRTMNIGIDQASMRRLEQEAERRGVPFERLCEHAALLLLADMDSGMVAERVIERARSGPSSSQPRSDPG